MSRSYRKHLITGTTCADSEKTWKVLWHRRYRSRVRDAIRVGKEAPLIREVVNLWDGPKDGKTMWDETFFESDARWTKYRIRRK